jgi:hypothetical protein
MKLFQVSKEFNPSSEFEYTTKYFLWADDLSAAQTIAEDYVRIDGFQWSDEDQAFVEIDGINCVRIEVEQTLFLDVVNGPLVDIREAIETAIEISKISKELI